MQVTLRLVSRDEADAFTLGRAVPPAGLRWDPDYPTEDTFIALGLLRLAYAAAGHEVGERPDWWLHQIVVRSGGTGVGGRGQDVVVGDIGFHGPPEPGATGSSPATVEIGYHVVPSWRGRGVATAACGLVLTQAWDSGAAVVRAEAAGTASQIVLTRNGFRSVGGHWYEIERSRSGCPG